MRRGSNPVKSAVAEMAPPEAVTIATITHVPFLSAYWEHALEVIETSLTTARETAGVPHDLLVFDNASCPEVAGYLERQRQSGLIDYLVRSHRNVGVIGAWNVIFGAVPGEVVAYMDSDVLMYQDWLPPHLEVLDAFPDVGMVSGLPLRHPGEGYDYFRPMIERLKQLPAAEVTGDGPPREWTLEHYRSLGVSEERYRSLGEPVTGRVSSNGVTAYIGAQHFQFVARKERIQRILPLGPLNPVGKKEAFDVVLAEDGALLLSTSERYALHMGNTPLSELPAGAQAARSRPEAVESKPAAEGSKARALVVRVAQTRVVRRVLMAVYHRIFRLYFGSSSQA